MDIDVLKAMQTADSHRAWDINSTDCREYFSKVLDDMGKDDCITNHETDFHPSGAVILRYSLNGDPTFVIFNKEPEESYVDKYLDKFEDKNDNSGFYIFLAVLLGIAVGCIMFICL